MDLVEDVYGRLKEFDFCCIGSDHIVEITIIIHNAVL